MHLLFLQTINISVFYIHNIRLTNGSLVLFTSPCTRKWRLRVFDFLVSKWLLKALYLRILPVPVTLKVFFARECVFIFGIYLFFWERKGTEKTNRKSKINFLQKKWSCAFEITYSLVSIIVLLEVLYKVCY